MDDLAAHFKSPNLAWLVERLATRLAQGKPLDRGTVTLADASAPQRRAVDALLGRRSTLGHGLSINLAHLARILNLDAAGLHSLVTAVRGPVTNRRAEREAEEAHWAALWSQWRDALSLDPVAQAWVDDLNRTGLLKRLSNRDPQTADALLQHCHTILNSAPHDDAFLASLAARITGDSHALDRGRPLAALCLRAIKTTHRIDGTQDANARREAWAAIGVSLDDLSAPVLCLNLRPAPGSEAARWIDWHAQRGEPYYLTWRQVRTFEPHPDTEAVYICENPAIVSEAANHLAARCRPLICLNGLPNAPAKVLLRRLIDRSIPLHLRADFDWTGLRIVDQFHDPSNPAIHLWRMTADDYRACRATQPLTGVPCQPGWADELATAIQHSGLAAYEEELIDVLLADLDASKTVPSGGSQPPPAAPEDDPVD